MEVKKGIPMEAFCEPPEEIQSYSVGDQLTRSNFIGYMTESHQGTRGSRGGQLLFFNWDLARTGNNYMETIYNYLGAGGWMRLMEEEKEYFIGAFEAIKVPHHRTVAMGEALWNGKIFDKNLTQVSQHTSLLEFGNRYNIFELATLSHGQMREKMEQGVRAFEESQSLRSELL